MVSRYGMVVNLDRCVGCKSCVAACALTKGLPKGVRVSALHQQTTGKFPALELTYLPTACMQCDNPACVPVCPVGATTKDANGVITVDESVCIGCGACAKACPYGARSLIGALDSNHEGAALLEFEAKAFAKHKAHVMAKCDFCKARVDNGEQPACVAACVAHARIFGDLNDASSEVSKLAKDARVLLKDKGTGPALRYTYKGKNDLDGVFKA